ncbi:MAG TPA: aminopeptidase P N-terminal domain-containing protein [Acidimicrobiia bacterium]|jgi:Xaa-Pro aminopeptidase|nr:aminopeptidase P N-terminal domain-containing protein [Acidimicrobiia bacterium]
MADRYSEARRRLAEVVGTEGLAVIPAALEVIRNYDVTHPFRQDSAFWYLTGFPEPEAVAVIAPGHPDGDFTLFVRPKDPALEVWTGIRAGTEGATEHYGADAAYELDELDDVLERMMHGRDVLWYSTGNDHYDDRIAGIVKTARAHRERMGGVVPSAVRDVSVPLGEMMLYKSPEEAASLRQATHLSAEGHMEAMRFARPGMYEYQVQAALEYLWRLRGSRRNGYDSIVASGANACVLHYVENNSRIEDGDLILIDAAAEVDGYSSDITRTFPANGKFTSLQQAVYDIVLSAQKKSLEMSVPGSDLRTVHETSTRILTEGMVELGLLPLSVDESVAMHHYSHFYMHGTSHWLGLDVHDRGAYRIDGKHRPLEPGMSFTVEPALYVAPDKTEIELIMLEHDLEEWNQRRIRLGRAAAAAAEAEERENAEKIKHTVPAELLGIGIRIEDDVLITPEGHENMSAAVPKEIDEIEALCAESSVLPAS